MGLDQFLHFRLAIIERKACGLGGGWAHTFGVVTSLTFLQSDLAVGVKNP